MYTKDALKWYGNLENALWKSYKRNAPKENTGDPDCTCARVEDACAGCIGTTKVDPEELSRVANLLIEVSIPFFGGNFGTN